MCKLFFVYIFLTLGFLGSLSFSYAEDSASSSDYSLFFSKTIYIRKNAERPTRKWTIQSPNPASHTFVFFVNDSADHWSSQTTLESDLERSLYHYVKNIDRLAQNCVACNVVVLFIQSGETFFSNASQTATYLTVYSRGEVLIRKKRPTVNAADPVLLQGLLKFSVDVFPDSNLHLIYLGHSFHPKYEPKPESQFLPFDFNHPESAYGVDTFATSLQNAKLSKPLESITLAGCRMAHFEIAALLSPYSKNLIASQTGVVEVLNVGFRFDFLEKVSDKHSSGDVVSLIANHLMSAYRSETYNDDLLMEHPTSVLHLENISQYWDEFQKLVAEITQVKPKYFEHRADDLLAKARVYKNVSDHYVRELKRRKKTEEQIRFHIEFIKVAFAGAVELDLILVLDYFAQDSLPLDLIEKAKRLKVKIQAQIQVLDRPTYPQANKSGLSITSLWLKYHP